MLRNQSLPTLGQSRSRLVFFLSGETSSLPEAEARALLLSQDANAKIVKPEDRVLIAETTAPVDYIAGRIAYTRRVGFEIPDGRLNETQLRWLENSSCRVRAFKYGGARNQEEAASSSSSSIMRQLEGRVDLDSPDYEITIISGKKKEYFVLTKPMIMRQAWASRRPRARPYFHPAAIFPKLARALVNLTRVRDGETLLDPFVGTGSILLEAASVGVRAVGVDISGRMARGALANQRKFGQEWLGLIKGDSSVLPLVAVDAVATDVPYGRASSTSGSETKAILRRLLDSCSSLLAEGRRLVIMHPSHVLIESDDDFAAEGEQQQHHLYIHRKLTRTITVLRRV